MIQPRVSDEDETRATDRMRLCTPHRLILKLKRLQGRLLMACTQAHAQARVKKYDRENDGVVAALRSWASQGSSADVHPESSSMQS